MVKAASSKAPKPPSQAAIARTLNLSKASISKLKKLGMPISSVEAARAWRDANLCFDGRRVELNPGRLRSDPSPLDCVKRVRAFIPAAMAAVEAGCFAEVEAELRQALQAVPDSHADRISMPFAVWDALTVGVRQALDEMMAEDGFSAEAGELSEADAEEMGRFWLQAARGWVRVA